jgi:hypothetical protein
MGGSCARAAAAASYSGRLPPVADPAAGRRGVWGGGGRWGRTPRAQACVDRRIAGAEERKWAKLCLTSEAFPGPAGRRPELSPARPRPGTLAPACVRSALFRGWIERWHAAFGKSRGSGEGRAPAGDEIGEHHARGPREVRQPALALEELARPAATALNPKSEDGVVWPLAGDNAAALI